MRKLIASYYNGNPRSDFHAVEQNLYYYETKNFTGYKLVIEHGTLYECHESGWYGYGKAVVTLPEVYAKKAEATLNNDEYVEWYDDDFHKNTINVYGFTARVR